MLKNIGVIFGGMSTEHEVSIASARSIINNLNQDKYNIFPIYIDKRGNWYEVNKTKIESTKENIKNDISNIENIVNYLKNMDILFPVLHGKYGEDGSIQGLFELIKKPYVGCGILSSSIGMDKVYTKIIFDRLKIKQAKYQYIRKYKDSFIYVSDNFEEEILSLNNVVSKIIKRISMPMFVKPSNAGSSIGITKVNDTEELKNAIIYASKFDNKILIEESVNGREIECAVLGNEEVLASCLGEVKSGEDFYSFSAKYKNDNSKVIIPAKLPQEVENEIKKYAIRVFKAISGKGLSRIDFFVDKKDYKIYINEINTLPGFTSISMYPKLFENEGITYRELLDKLINLSIKKNP